MLRSGNTNWVRACPTRGTHLHAEPGRTHHLETQSLAEGVFGRALEEGSVWWWTLFPVLFPPTDMGTGRSLSSECKFHRNEEQRWPLGIPCQCWLHLNSVICWRNYLLYLKWFKMCDCFSYNMSHLFFVVVSNLIKYLNFSQSKIYYGMWSF